MTRSLFSVILERFPNCEGKSPLILGSELTSFNMRSLFYFFMALLVITMFFPDISQSAETLLLRLLELANDVLSGATI